MATGKRAVTLGILGSGNVEGALVCDTLNDHFSMGPEDHEGYFGASDKYELRVTIPAGDSVTSGGVHAVWEWAIRCELPYTVLWDETGNDHTVDVLGNVMDAESDITIVPDVAKAMIEHLRAAEHPMLLVLSEDEAFDPVTAEAAAAALREGIPCHDLARALLEVEWRHLPDHEPPQEPAIEVEADGQTAIAIDSDAPHLSLAPSEGIALGQALTAAEEFITRLETEVVCLVEPLRKTLVHGRSLLAPKPEVVEGDKEPKKTRLEIFNPETNSWEPAGRGRPPKSAQTRRVPA